MATLSDWNILETVWADPRGASCNISFNTTPSAGELLVAVISLNNDNFTEAGSTGWTRGAVDGFNFRTIAFFYKVATSSETNSYTFNVVGGFESQFSVHAFRISGSFSSSNVFGGAVFQHEAAGASSSTVTKSSTTLHSLVLAYAHTHTPSSGTTATGAKTWNTGWQSIQSLHGTNDRTQSAFLQAEGTSHTATVSFNTGTSDRFSTAIAEFIYTEPGTVGMRSETIYDPNTNSIVADTSTATVRIWDASTISGAPAEVLTNQSITNGVLEVQYPGATANTAVSYQVTWVGGSGERYFIEAENQTTENL